MLAHGTALLPKEHQKLPKRLDDMPCLKQVLEMQTLRGIQLMRYNICRDSRYLNSKQHFPDKLEVQQMLMQKQQWLFNLE